MDTHGYRYSSSGVADLNGVGRLPLAGCRSSGTTMAQLTGLFLDLIGGKIKEGLPPVKEIHLVDAAEKTCTRGSGEEYEFAVTPLCK